MKFERRPEDIERDEAKALAMACFSNLKSYHSGIAELEKFVKENEEKGLQIEYTLNANASTGKTKTKVSIIPSSKEAVFTYMKQEAKEYAKKIRMLCQKAKIRLDEDEEEVVAVYERLK